MKGSVTKYHIKGSSRPRWRYRICVGKNSDGKYLYEGGGGFEKKGDAEKEAAKHIQRLHEPPASLATPHPDPPPAEKTLGEWLTYWLGTYACDTCEPKTLERYRDLSQYVLAAPAEEMVALAQTPLSVLRRPQLRSAFFALLRAPGKRTEHISAHTVRHVAGVVSSALNEAVEQELLTCNPMFRLKLPRVERREARSLTPEEIRALREACRSDWTFTFVEVKHAFGGRRGEMLALQWSDVDWGSRVLAITKSLEETKRGLRLKATKNRRCRRVRLPQNAMVALQFQREQQAAHRRLLGSDFHDNNLVFCQPDGSYLVPHLVSQTIIRRLRKAGIRGASLHTLRHSHASNLLSRGVPLPAVSERLGHSDPNVTARIYAHALPSDDQRAADEWDDIVGPIE